ncbi:hypothetical protein FRC00_002379 [Tulasnella sp. 408]|nr:hypothetical protein FRC00_002379 [Tulasnella sp. 408]
MAESAHGVASPSKRKQYIVREEERFSRIYDALPSHLRQAEVPEPLKNLSTPENERLTRLHEAAEQGRGPSETLADMYFIDEMQRVLNDESAEFPSSQLGVRDGQAEIRSEANLPSDRGEGSYQHHVNLNLDNSAALGDDSEYHSGPSPEESDEMPKRADALRHSQRAPNPDENSGDKSPRMQNNGSASSVSATIKPSTVILPARQEFPKYVFTISQSLKEKEKAQDSEGVAKPGANLPTNRIETTLQGDSDGSYASRVAMNEAKQSGLSQEQIELMARFHDSSKVGGEEGGAGSFGDDQGNQPHSDTSNTSDREVRGSRLLPHVADPEQASSSALAQSQSPSNNGIIHAQSSPPSREASPARTDTGSDITYDDGVQDDEQDMGGTSGGGPEQSGPATPGPTKRKRTVTPSTGSEERPATKHRRPGFDAEEEPSPLPQSRVRHSRRDLISTPRQPLRRWNTDPSLRSDPTLEARSMVDGIPLRGLRPSDSIPEEEATEVAGSNSLGMATDRAGDTEDDGRETEPQFDQIPIRVVIEASRFLVAQDARESTLGPAATARTTNDTQASLSAEDPSQQAPTNLLPDGMCLIKVPYHVRLISDSSAAEDSEPTSSSAPPASSRAEPSTSATATPNQNLRTQRHADSASQTDRLSTSDSQGSSHPVIAHGHAPEFLGLLRAWRAAFINLDDELLAEAGLRVSRGGTSTQETRVEQTTEEAPNPQTHEEEHYQILLLSLLENFRVKNAAKIAAPARWIRLGSSGGELEGHSTTVPLTDLGILEKTGARPPLGASDPDTTNLGQVLALLKDSLGSNDLASAPGTFTPTHVNQALASGREDHGTDIAGAQTEESATNQSNARSSNQPAAINARGNRPPNESDTAEVKAKQKATKSKSKKGKNTEKLDPSPVSPGASRITTSDNLDDIEMTVSEVQPSPHTSDPPANDPAMPQTAVSLGSLQARLPSPMDTDWDDDKSEAECSGGKKGGKQDSARPNNRDNEPPSNSSIQKQEHPEGSSSIQPTTSKEKKPKKKKDSCKPGTTRTSVAPAARPGEAPPPVEALPEPSPAAPTPSEPPEATPPRRVSTPIGQTSSTPPTVSPPSSRDEVMLDIESPQRLPEREVNHGAQIPAEETFGEGPIVPDDEGPPVSFFLKT